MYVSAYVRAYNHRQNKLVNGNFEYTTCRYFILIYLIAYTASIIWAWANTQKNS